MGAYLNYAVAALGAALTVCLLVQGVRAMH
jgi:hypothetical protein